MTTETKTAKEVDVVEVKPVHFVIEISLETHKNGDQYTVPRNIPETMHPGDTVTYESSDGQVTVKFDKDQLGSPHTSPYVGATGDLQEVQGGEVLNVVNEGKYFGKCFITRTIPVFEVVSSPTTHESLTLDTKPNLEAKARLAAWQISAGSLQTGLHAHGDAVNSLSGFQHVRKVRTETIGWKEEDSSEQDGSKQHSLKQVKQDSSESGGNHVVKGPGG